MVAFNQWLPALISVLLNPENREISEYYGNQVQFIKYNPIFCVFPFLQPLCSLPSAKHSFKDWSVTNSRGLSLPSPWLTDLHEALWSYDLSDHHPQETLLNPFTHRMQRCKLNITLISSALTLLLFYPLPWNDSSAGQAWRNTRKFEL